jgi:hypothetical protein
MWLTVRLLRLWLVFCAVSTMALDATQANSMLTYMHGGGAPRTITGSRMRLMTANGTASANGTEVATGGGYTASTGSNPTVAGAAVTWGTAASQSQANSAIVSFTNYPRSETVVGIEIWSTDATPGLRVEWGALTVSKAMGAGDTLSFAVSAVTSALA